MFNLFSKKTEQPSKEVLVAEKPKYPKVVEDIHNEFFTAGDNVLLEATSLLKELETKDLAKGKRLASLGFGKTREAVAAIETQNKLTTTKEIANLVMYYKREYPFNKFITEAQVKAICEKYSLVCGSTSMYNGFVPENKLSLIEKFKLKKADTTNMWFEVTETHNGEGIKLPVSYISDNDLTEFGVSYFKGNARSLNYFYIVGSTGYSDLIKPEIAELFSGLQYVKATMADMELKICAPLKDMEIPAHKEVKGYKIQDIPDPVVLQPVKGGYLIICAWGNESSDPIVVNEINN
jgi:hypothetical protein